jgi:hypothetical protein
MDLRIIAQRAAGVGVAVVAAGTLPVTAGLLDDKVDENWLFPISIGAAGALGATAGLVMPHMFGAARGRLAGAAIGAGIGVGVNVAADAALLFGIADRS